MTDETDARLRRYVDEARAKLDKMDWLVQAVGGGLGDPPFTYSVGLSKYGHPEIAIVGFDPETCRQIINEAAYLVRDGADFRTPVLAANVIRNFDVAFRPVDAASSRSRCGAGKAILGVSEYPLVQLFFPDPSGAFPWQKKCDPLYARLQTGFFEVEGPLPNRAGLKAVDAPTGAVPTVGRKTSGRKTGRPLASTNPLDHLKLLRAELSACRDLLEGYPKKVSRSSLDLAVGAGYSLVHLGQGKVAYRKRTNSDSWTIASGDGSVSARAEDDAWTVRRSAVRADGTFAVTTVEEGVPLASLLDVAALLPAPAFVDGRGYDTKYATWYDVLSERARREGKEVEKVLGKTLLRAAYAEGFEYDEDRARAFLIKFDEYDRDTWWEISADGDVSAHPDRKAWTVSRVCCAQDGQIYRSHVKERTTLSTAVGNIGFVPDAFENRSVARWSAAKEMSQFRPGYPL
ncbi:DUF4262 domain-containing protein [Rhizobium leguminosarum]|uniref:DUF4262 domain-containing protein n=1 Tax=Rhizobium leguminosarum TaxID=384 RepID=UPI002E15A3BE|nr:DUF4262 domain-containing protein [Rhizobium leguminosarum]